MYPKEENKQAGKLGKGNVVMKAEDPPQIG